MYKRKSGVAVILLIVCLMVACNQTHTSGSKEMKENVINHHAIDFRNHHVAAVDITKPIATFEANMQDQVTDNDFIVKVFPTLNDDSFKIDIQYGGNTASDVFSMIPSEYYDKIELIKGNNSNECILGFIGKDGDFNKMKLITGSRTSIGIKTLKAYYLSTK